MSDDNRFYQTFKAISLWTSHFNISPFGVRSSNAFEELFLPDRQQKLAEIFAFGFITGITGKCFTKLENKFMKESLAQNN